MNTVLLMVQELWVVFFSVTGFGKVLCYNPACGNQGLQEAPRLSAVPHDLFISIGVCEFLGGVGLLMPAMTGVKPKLTPFGAFGPTLVTGRVQLCAHQSGAGRDRRIHRVWTIVCEAHSARVDQ